MAKARAQAAAAEAPSDVGAEGAGGREESESGITEKLSLEDSDKSRVSVKKNKPTNVFLALSHIAQIEGVGALYSGISGEVLKGFFSHGLTMLLKERLSGLVLRLWYAIAAMLKGQRTKNKT